MRRLGLGLGISAQRASSGGGGPPNAVNTVAPSIDAIAYPSGAYNLLDGTWTNATSFAYALESSPTGAAPWTDVGTVPNVGTWSTSLENLYVRSRITAQPGSVVAYSAPFLIGPIFDQMVDFAGNANWIDHAVTANFLGMSAGDGIDFWLMVQWYYPGSGLEGGAGLVSLGNVANASSDASLHPSFTLWRDGGTNGGATLDVVSGAGTYLNTGRFRNVGSTHGSTMLVNDAPAVSGSNSGAISLTGFTTLRIGAVAQSSVSNAENSDYPIAWVAFGKGNPAAGHAWVYNEGQQRRADEYDWGTDPNGATLEGFIMLSRKSPGNTTYTVANTIDSIGAYDSWTQTGSLAWTGRLPGFVNSAGDPPATPVAYISPRYASEDDANLTLNINTKKIGEALGGDLTITTLTHSVAGNIAGTVSGSTFPNPGPGTITGTVNGVAVNCEIIANTDFPAYAPNFRTRYNGNARVAAIENYPAPGAGTTYANIAAMKVAIDALGAGGTLIINDLTEAGTLTLTAKDYGGATLVCTNRHGVAINQIVMTGVQNLTLRGFSCLNGGFSAGSFSGNITLDHCTGINWDIDGTTGATETLTITNWIGPDDGTAVQCYASKINRYTIKRVAHGNTVNPTAGDVNRTDRCNIIIADRFWFGESGTSPTGGNPDPHVDGWQTVTSGTTGAVAGLVQNGIIIDEQKAGETGAQGLFFSDINGLGLRIRNCAIRVPLTNAITIANAQQNCRIENTTVSTRTFFQSNALSNSVLADNNVMNNSGNILPSTGTGVETNTLASVTMATAYPQWTSHAYTWEQWDNPAGGYTTAGAYALIDELAANKASYP